MFNLLEVLFPKRCLCCHEYGQYLCQHCYSKIPRHSHVCIVCRKQSHLGITHPYCKENSHIDQVFIPLVYEEHTRKAINTIKLQKAYHIIPELTAKAITPQLRQTLLQKSFTTITSIPSHPQKIKYRGFNLATEIAQYLAQELHVPFHALLYKTKNTTPQSELTRLDRLFNPQHTFTPTDIQLPKSSQILLIDDILTTGTTLDCAAEVIKSHYHPQLLCALVLCSK